MENTPKKKKLIWTLIEIILVLLIVYLGISVYNATQSSNSEEGRIDGKDYFFNSLGDIEGIYIYNEAGEMLFVKNNGKWHYSEDQDVEINQSIIDALARVISKLGYEREVNRVESLNTYGLDPPLYIISFVDKNEYAATLYIGEAIGDYCYMKFNDSETVYAISDNILSYLSYSLEDMIIK